MIDRNNGRILKILNGSSCGFGYFVFFRDEKKIIYFKVNLVVCEDVIWRGIFLVCRNLNRNCTKRCKRYWSRLL